MKLEPEISAIITSELQKMKGTVSEKAMLLGTANNEPLLEILNACMRYAKAYAKRFESPLGEDYVLGVAFASMLQGCRSLLDGDGAVAMEKGVTTDSKDNGTYEAIYWKVCEVAQIDGNQ